MWCYCFSSIFATYIPESLLIENYDERPTLQDLTSYELTEVEIGCSEDYYIINEGDPPNSQIAYYFAFYRNGMHVMKEMAPGSITIKKLDNKEFLIDLDYSEDTAMLHVKTIRLRYLNIIKEKGEENMAKVYTEYLNKVKQYAAKNDCDMDTAFKNTMFMKTSSVKTLKQTMRSLRDAINDLCDPETGCIANVSDNPRYICDKPSTWSDDEHIVIENLKNYNSTKRTKKNNLTHLHFQTIKIEQLDVYWFKSERLYLLSLENVEIPDKSIKAWTSFALKMSNLKNLGEFVFTNSKLDDLPDIVFQYLPESLYMLDLSGNNLAKISQKISRLTNLHELNLNNNPLLDDKGFPWNDLPITLARMKLSQSGIKIIPPSIVRLEKLEFFSLQGTLLKDIAWGSINSFIASINFDNLQSITEINCANFPKMLFLEIRKSQIKKIDLENMPRRISRIILENNGIEEFKFHTNLVRLRILNLSENKIKTFPWTDIPQTLEILNLSKNQIEEIGPIQFWIHLHELDLSSNIIHKLNIDNQSIQNHPNRKLSLHLSKNYLSKLPIGFEDIVQISELTLINNQNNFDLKNINEYLWNQLPRCLIKLNISDNALKQLPCQLKNIPLKELIASGCELNYICPQISRHARLDANFCIDVSKNPGLKNLSFTPKVVLPFTSSKTTSYEMERNWTEEGKQLSHKIKILTDQSYRITDRSHLYQGKLEFTFKEFSNKRTDEKVLGDSEAEGTSWTPHADIIFQDLFSENENENDGVCKCCANCETQTENKLVEEVMTMDFTMFIKTSKNTEIWDAGKWKTNVRTKICENCIEWYKKEAEDIYIESVANATEKAIMKEPKVKKMKQNKALKEPKAKKPRRIKKLAAISHDLPESSKDSNSDGDAAIGSHANIQQYPTQCSSQTLPSIFNVYRCHQQVYENANISVNSRAEQNFPQLSRQSISSEIFVNQASSSQTKVITPTLLNPQMPQISQNYYCGNNGNAQIAQEYYDKSQRSPIPLNNQYHPTLNYSIGETLEQQQLSQSNVLYNSSESTDTDLRKL